MANSILRIKEVLKEKDLTINDLAKKMEINRVTLSNMINGNPTLDTLKEIAHNLNVPIWEIFSDLKFYLKKKTSTTRPLKYFVLKRKKEKEGTPKAITDLIKEIMKKHNYSFDNNDLEAHYFDFSFPELYYEQLKEKA